MPKSKALLYSLSTCVLLACPWVGVSGDAVENADILRIVVPKIERSARNHLYYFPELLDLALSKTQEEDGPYTISHLSQSFTTERLLAELKAGRAVNVIWTSPDRQREVEFLPIRISLLRGLNSHRIFLIRAEDEEKFKAVRTLDDLRKFRAGQVSHWPDTAVIQANALPITTSAHYELLFTMLAGKRFDYFPRGLYEAWEEQKANADKGLVLESSLMFYYPAPIYFFVNRSNVQLANRIERGLNKAIEDGSFDTLFFSIPGFKRGYDEISNSQRRVFELVNPDISSADKP